jgi:3'-phosphoadenosine 5'-phosphosulfate sulfotransferase
MARRQVRGVKKDLTEEERTRHRAIRQKVEEEKVELIARGRKIKARNARLREAVRMLRAAREALGLSLADIRERTGIEKGNLSRLENAAKPNPTVDTLTRYADAVGKELVITLIDKPPTAPSDPAG